MRKRRSPSTGMKYLSPATMRIFNGKRYYILTNVISKFRASSIAKSYRETGGLARVVKVRGGYVVYAK